MSSHRMIHYGLRPGKNIERKMICDVFQRLAHFHNLNEYRYVGFGSRYFSDFTLIHKSLGIGKMISIEHEEKDQEWFEFNRPYNCIESIYSHSNVALPSLTWDMPTILWLDYDGKLSPDVFFDIGCFCSSAVAGSLILVTVNAHSSREEGLLDRVQQLKEEIGEERVPTDTKPSDLGQTGRPKIYRKIIDNQIRESLKIRNGTLLPEQRLNYLQLFNFVYQDGAQMLTIGGIIYADEDKPLLDRCSFMDFEFVKLDQDAYKIEVPNLTFREIHYLNQLLPLTDELPQSFIPKKEIEQYARIYRYFPAFTEAEV